jgi:hypothetical protein
MIITGASKSNRLPINDNSENAQGEISGVTKVPFLWNQGNNILHWLNENGNSKFESNANGLANVLVHT